jgi:hypothetical protein
MKKYMAMYMAPAATIAEVMKSTPAQQKAGMDAWMSWANKNKKGVTDLGAPLGKTMRVTASGSSPAKNEITGYSVIQADSLEAAARIFKDHPHLQLKGASVEVLEYVPMEGMSGN